ncbi:unnamed protein product [Clonostachys chloroleuca]|uniref:mannan endo-1,4-beta-mannosidase n=1 Tax=Clonostachys chloroleuca TaxID=1926264 RepID=A0AA35QCK5_9HYPO|nr:unnamed protein product [Clonostachys chloroleuca]
MKLSTFLAPALLAFGFVPATLAAKSFSASNLYYAAGLTEDQQATLFEGLQSAGVKVLRVWLDGQSGNTKGTEINDFGALEAETPGVWDDTVLNRLDDVMANAHGYGIKLLISIHSYNALDTKADVYGNWYGTGDFYTNTDAIGYFKRRIDHVLSHVNPHNNKPWSESSEYIFAIEAQNEAMHGQENVSALEAWQCNMAEEIKNGLKGSTDILISTGGGAWLDNSLLDSYFNCDALDVLAIHAYGIGDFETSKLKPYVKRAQDAGKMLIMQEWGACYTDASNNDCNGGTPLDAGTRDINIKAWAAKISAAGIPSFYWQILPNPDPHHGWDYEVGINDVNWDALREASVAAGNTEAAFDFGHWLL